jgi:polysaccharide pyruvyl transferase WcaK-like protein
MRRINIVGWYGAKNIGDDSFRDVFQKQLPDKDLIFSHIPNLDSDAIILGGGGVVTGQYLDGLNSYNNPLYAVGVDIAVNGPEWDDIQRLNFQKLYVRSKEYVGIASLKANNIEYCPDIAFSIYNPDQVAKGTRTCGLILSHDLKGGIDHLGQLVRWLQTDFDTIVFIVMYTGKTFDLEVTQKVMDECKVPCSLIIPSTPEETLQVMSNLDLVISMRFHGVIFATVLGLPFLTLANKGKCSLFCEQERLFGHHIELS